MLEPYGFVYIWYNRWKKKFYIGCHWGHESDGYVCSSKLMREAYKRNPEYFTRRVLGRVFTNRLELLELEERWLKLIPDGELGRRYYNLRRSSRGMFREPGAYEHSDSTRQRISDSMRGKVLTEETKAKIRQKRAHQVISEETKEKIRQANLNREYGEDFKAKMKNVALDRPKEALFGGKRYTGGMLGKQHSVETKMAMAAKAKEKVSCPHCGLVGSVNPMRRWHFDNCKQNPILQQTQQEKQ